MQRIPILALGFVVRAAEGYELTGYRKLNPESRCFGFHTTFWITIVHSSLYQPVQIAVLHSLVVLVLVDVEGALEVEPALELGLLNRDQTVQDGEQVEGRAERRIAVGLVHVALLVQHVARDAAVVRQMHIHRIGRVVPLQLLLLFRAGY